MRILVLLGAILGTFVLTYLVVGKGMNQIFILLALIIIFLVGFFSVKVSLVFLALSIALSPEIGMGATEHRAVTGRAEDIVLLVLTIGWLLRMAIIKDIGFVLKTKMNGPIIAFCSIAIFSTALGVFRGDIWEPLAGMFFVLKLVEYFFLFYVVVNYVQTEKEVHNLLSVLMAVVGIICLYALVNRAAGGAVQAPFEGSVGEKNTLSGYLVLMGSVIAGVLFYTRNKIERLFLAGILVLSFIVLLASLSRSGWMSFLISFLVLFAVIKTKNIYPQIIVVVLLVLPMFLPNDVTERFKYTYSVKESSVEQVTLWGVKLDPSSSARIISWRRVINLFPVHPIFGWGITGFGFIDGQYFRWLAEIGIVGFCIFIWLLASVHAIVRSAMANKDLPPRLQGMARGFYAGFWGVLAHAATANSFIIVRIAEPFWFITGLIVVTLAIYEQKTAKDKELMPERYLPGETNVRLYS